MMYKRKSFYQLQRL